MNFLKNIFQRLFNRVLTNRGLINPAQHAGSAAPSSKRENQPVSESHTEEKKSELDIFENVYPADFLEDLRSVESINKPIEKAREELVQELKRLAPERRTNIQQHPNH
jgi:hypothetical protein